MSRSQHRHQAWQWFKAEIARQISEEACAALFAEYSARAKADKRYNDRVDAPALLDRLRLRQFACDRRSAEYRRLEKRIARLQALLDAPQEEERA
jgi:hypothetical protein